MELNDAIRRVWGQHRWLILGCVVFGLAVGLVLDVARPRSYTASARLALDTEDPKTQPESAAVADIAKAIATTPGTVAAALRAVHLDGRRDPVVLAREDVDVTSLGSSGIVQLSVSDSDAHAAAAIADSLSRRVIATRLAVTRGEASSAGRRLDQRIAQLDREIVAADQSIDRLTVKIAGASDPVNANSIRAQRDDVQRRRDFLAQQRAVVESQRASLLAAGASRPEPAIIGEASVPPGADTVLQPADIVLGGMLGLILALGAAGLLETLRPTLVDTEAIGAALDAPVLGALSRRPQKGLPVEELARVAGRLRLAARGARVRHVGLVAATGGVDVGRLADELTHALAATSEAREAVPVAAGGAGRSAADHKRNAVRVSVYDPESPLSANGTVLGLVVVSLAPVARPALGDAEQLLRVSAAPLLGVIGVAA